MSQDQKPMTAEESRELRAKSRNLTQKRGLCCNGPPTAWRQTLLRCQASSAHLSARGIKAGLIGHPHRSRNLNGKEYTHVHALPFAQEHQG